MGNGKERPYGTYNETGSENIVTEMWLKPDAYCDIQLDESTKTVSGGTIPKGDSLLKTFPNGMVVVGLNNMKTIWAIHDENVKDHIVSGLYHVQSFSGVGKGISDAVDAMKDLNDLHSQLLTHIKTHAMPGYGYNSNVVSEAQARDIGKARKNIAIDFTQAPDGINDVNQLIRPLVPSNPAQAAFAYKESLENDLQFAMQVTDFTNGLPGVDNKTATGAKIGDANAATLLQPQHLNKADHRKRSDVVIYNLFKKFVDKKKFFANNAKNGITKGRYISGSDFDGVDIDFEVVANSEIPKTPFEQQEAMMQILQFTGGIGGLIEASQMSPELTGEIVSAFGGKLSIPKKTDIARICRRRIEQVKKILEGELQTQQLMSQATAIPFDNANLASQVVSQMIPKISPQEMYAPLKAQWMAELLDSDELQYETPELRYCIEEMISIQTQTATFGEAERMRDENIGTAIANLPMILGEQAMSQQAQSIQQEYEMQQAQAQAEQQAVQTAVQNQQALDVEQQKAEIAETQARTNHERSRELSDDSHGKALQLKAIDHLAQMQANKQKPKAATAK